MRRSRRSRARVPAARTVAAGGMPCAGRARIGSRNSSAPAESRSVSSSRSPKRSRSAASRPDFLRHDFHGAQLQRPDRRRRARARVARHHDDRPRRLGHDVADGAQPIELGHLQVHQHQVGLQPVHLLQRVHAVPRRAHHGEVPAALQDVGEQAAEERAVVGDQDRPALRGAGHRARPMTRRSGRPCSAAAPCGRSRHPPPRR